MFFLNNIQILFIDLDGVIVDFTSRVDSYP